MTLKPGMRFTVDLPEWAMVYLINGDATGYTDEDIKMIEEFDAKYDLIDYNMDDRNEFDIDPAFGLPCATVPAVVEVRFPHKGDPMQ